ncbi:uncharacterized protein BDV14DRAFT_169029 [Aspergillus stella-maris]|uniref:uncharacterized protein n=1 Tax=Aspergillus stella-maris TaxID=1810926 RepID=UPI003CCD8B61
MYLRDNWPNTPDGTPYNGKNLLKLVIDKKSPFDELWDVRQLLAEIERNLRARIVDIPIVVRGSCHAVCYGIHITLHNQPPILVRLSRTDINHPKYSGPPAESQVSAARFESGLYKLLRAEEGIPVSQLLYYRPPMSKTAPKGGDKGEGKETTRKGSKDLSGRSLFVFSLPEGRTRTPSSSGVNETESSGGFSGFVWDELNSEQRDTLLTQCASIRASLFNLTPPKGFSTFWLRERLCSQTPDLKLTVPVSPTREFCIALFEARVNSLLGQEQYSGNRTITATKDALLNLIPTILPEEEESGSGEPTYYRLILEHGNFGIHNMAIKQEKQSVSVTSLHDWDLGHILPAILSDPSLGTECLGWAGVYVETLFAQAPAYKRAIQAGKHARALWNMLSNWDGDDIEAFCEKLGRWADDVKRTSGL